MERTFLHPPIAGIHIAERRSRIKLRLSPLGQQHQMKRICLWSGPRNVSTALMYSFAQRSDTLVVDEPLYGHYLVTSGAEHPGRDEVIAAMDCDGDAVMAELLHRHSDRPVLFAKQMAHHLVGIDWDLLGEFDHLLLIRDPQEMLPSLTIQLPNARLSDTGLALQWDLVSWLTEQGRPPTIVDSRELLLDPAGILKQACESVGVAFQDAMLSWPAGARPEDGVWAQYWYDSVHRSTGFMEYKAKTGFPDALRPLLDECRPYYEKLYAHALRQGA